MENAFFMDGASLFVSAGFTQTSIAQEGGRDKTKMYIQFAAWMADRRGSIHCGDTRVLCLGLENEMKYGRIKADQRFRTIDES